MSNYDLTLRCEGAQALSEAISSAHGIPGVEIKALATVTASAHRRSHKRHRYVGGHRNKGIGGLALIVELFKKKATRTTEELASEFVKHGFAKNSMSPRLAAYKASGKVKSVGPGVYKLV